MTKDILRDTPWLVKDGDNPECVTPRQVQASAGGARFVVDTRDMSQGVACGNGHRRDRPL